MESPVKQNYRDVWIFLRPFAALSIGMAVLCAVIAWANGQTDPASLFAGSLIILACLLAMLLLVAVVLMQPGVRWFITDDGLKRVYSGDTRMIPWAWIYRIGKTEIGYFIRWRDPTPGLPEEESEHKGILHLGKTDADALILLWRQKTSHDTQAQGQAHFKSANLRSFNRMYRWMWAMIGVGAALVCWGAVRIAMQYPSASWPSVDGRIISRQYRLVSQRRHQGQSNGQLTLSYEYVVVGRTNRSDQYSLWHAKYEEDQETADAFAKTNQTGATVKVFYNPKHPEQAVLLPGIDWLGNISLMGLGLCAIAFGSLMRNVFGRLRRGEHVLDPA